MKLFSFRLKLIIALFLIIVLTSLFSFLIFNKYLSARIYKNHAESITTMLSIIKEQYLFTISQCGYKNIYPLLDSLQSKSHILNAFLVSSDGELAYPAHGYERATDSLIQNKLVTLSKPITLEKIRNKDNSFLRAFMLIQNTAQCYQCHSPQKQDLGYVIMDFSMDALEENISFTQKFAGIHTLLLLIIISASVTVLHYKFVRKSLLRFKNTMYKIEHGKHDERVRIDKSDELGELADSFNKMLDKFQSSQNELQLYHQQELLNAQKLATVGEMAASVAHEIKNPLTGIANAIEIIVQEMHENEKKPVLEEIQRQIRRVNKTINDLLQFSRTVELYLEPGNINEIIKSVNFFLENQIRDKNITFVLNLQPDLPTFSFDHKHMENALINLGLNAIQAIEECGTVHISTIYNPEKKKVIIQIKDTGVGIPKENVSKIFRPFFTTRHKGTGLGLAITKEIIEKHNGTISVQCLFSKGSIFTILIPLQ